MDKSTTVPNLVGVASLERGVDLIRSAKLVLGGYSEEYSDTASAGAVISQNPVSGTPAKWNDPVSIVVSKGAQERTIYVHIAVDETNEGHLYAAAERRQPTALVTHGGQASSYQWSVTDGHGHDHAAEAGRYDGGAGC
ncbi:MAG: PASTA domain-containing protein [Ruthenibacterium lactatiformans]